MTLKLTIRFESAVHHASGFSLAGVVDKGFLRDHNGLPCLSGAALKGRFRDAARHILLADAVEVCQSGRKPRACGPPGIGRQEYCRVCQVFGAPALPARVVFTDAKPEPEAYEVMLAQKVNSVSTFHFGATDIRHSTSLDRLRRTVRTEHLFSLETVQPPVVFEAEIRGWMDAADEALLRECALLLNSFGAGGSRGLGACRYEMEPETIR
jgi:CRISPR/Cas system CSM-associated protein Csm3 (group 7 of RAMP superfamily)